jgi:uncharacterized protein with FMN-binding domain
VASAPPPAGQQPAAARPNGTTVVGADAPNQFGDVQVRVKVTGGKITAIDAVALPGGDSRSQEISASAGPILARQALVAQNANIDGVSGASYTSAGYRRSLQSALDQLGRVNRPPAPA